MKNKKADKELEGFMPENKKAEWECTTNPMPPNTKKCCGDCGFAQLPPKTGIDCVQPKCPCHTPAVEKWEIKFEKEFRREDGLLDIGKYDDEIIKDFIRSLLASREKEYESILKIKNKKWREWLQLARESDRKRILKWAEKEKRHDILYFSDLVAFITNLK